MKKIGKEVVICLTFLDDKPHAKTEFKQTVYADKDGKRFIRTMGNKKYLNDANEYTVNFYRHGW